MEISYTFLQQYWWFIISLLAAILVFLLFVQGGQGLLYTIGKTEAQRNMIVNSLGRKWELTFTTLVTFGGAFFASFPLFYSTSFGGAFYVWTLILLLFVIQAVAYEFRRKPHNLLGEKGYNAFLIINGIGGAFLLGVAVATLFTGGNFIIDRMNLSNIGTSTAISQWTNPYRGLEALLDYRNVLLGLSVLFLSRILALQYFMNNIDDHAIRLLSQRHLLYNSLPFIACFVAFVVTLMRSSGWVSDPISGYITIEKHQYLHNLIAMPILPILLTTGVVAVLTGIAIGIMKAAKHAVWYSGAGTILTVLSLLLMLGYNNTAYYPSLSDTQSSLTIHNSSSSEFTLYTMSIVSLMIPVVIGYISYVWISMNRSPITPEEMQQEDHLY